MTEVSLLALEYVQGSSDKFYRVFTVGRDVLTQYGRNGTYGTFTPRKTHLDPDKAQEEAAKVAAGKMLKGYRVTKTASDVLDRDPTEAELDRWASSADSGPIEHLVVPQVRAQAPTVAKVNATAPATSSGVMARVLDALGSRPTTTATQPGSVVPMLAHNAEPGNLEQLLISPQWGMQMKLDGDRVLVEVIDGEVNVYGRNGQAKVSNVSDVILQPFRAVTPGRFVFDGEVVGRTLWLFDLPVADGYLRSDATFQQRHTVLTALVLAMKCDFLGLVPVAEGEDAKRTMLQQAETGSKEGVMFRLLSARYVGGRSFDLLKHKFVKTIDCVVMESGVGGKESATLGVYDEAGTLVRVGKASTIGKNKRGGGIKEGQVVEVTFLYILDPDDPHLYQPRIMRVRTDKAAEECSTDQLVGAVTDRSVA